MKKISILFCFIFFISLLFFGNAKAVLIYDFGDVYSGDKPYGIAPWLTATFTTTGENTVTLELESKLKSSSEFISYAYFNVADPITGNYVPVTISTGSVGNNAFKADGDGFFDILIGFGNNNFGDSQILTFTITGAGINEDYFSALSTGGLGAAAHVQGIPGKDSGWIRDGVNSSYVPIPPAAWLLGSGLLGLVVIRRRMKK